MVFSIFLLTGCSKDFLKPYDDRIIGTWRISEVNRVGIGGNTDKLSFRDGTFTFNNDGSLVYTNSSGAEFTGHWNIQKKYYNDNDVKRSLEITAVDFINQQVLGEYYDDMVFRGTNHFKAKVFSGLTTYVTHFRR
jgi:hypothetical protein